MRSYMLGRFSVIVAVEYVVASITLAVVLAGYSSSPTSAANAAKKYADHLGQGLNFLLTLFIGIAIQKNFAVMSALRNTNGALRNLKTLIRATIDSPTAPGTVSEAYHYIVDMAIHTPELRRVAWEQELFQILDVALEDVKKAYAAKNRQLDEQLSDRWTEYADALVTLHATRMHFLPRTYTTLLFAVVAFYYGVVYPIANSADHGWYVLVDLVFAALFNNALYAVGMGWAEPFVNDNMSLAREYLIQSSQIAETPSKAKAGARATGDFSLNFNAVNLHSF